MFFSKPMKTIPVFVLSMRTLMLTTRLICGPSERCVCKAGELIYAHMTSFFLSVWTVDNNNRSVVGQPR